MATDYDLGEVEAGCLSVRVPPPAATHERIVPKVHANRVLGLIGYHIECGVRSLRPDVARMHLVDTREGCSQESFASEQRDVRGTVDADPRNVRQSSTQIHR